MAEEKPFFLNCNKAFNVPTTPPPFNLLDSKIPWTGFSEYIKIWRVTIILCVLVGLEIVIHLMPYGCNHRSFE